MVGAGCVVPARRWGKPGNMGNDEGTDPHWQTRRIHRLPDQAYRGRVAVGFTACVRERKPALANPEVVNGLVPLLARAVRAFACTALIYTFMPDHLHVLILGTTAEADTKAAMNKFKALSSLWLYRRRPDVHWQDGYYDRILDGHSRPDKQAWYIALNPVRRGLVADPFSWPYTGSIGHDLGEVLDFGARDNGP